MEPLDGYGKLSVLAGQHREMAILRRFSPLGAKNLLYRQAELIHLEAQLQRIINEDETSNDAEKTNYRCSVYELMYSLDKPGKDCQWRKVLEIREKLEQYYNAMLQFAQIQHLEQANKKDLELLREWLDRREGGDQFLQGREASTWSPEHTKDLVGIASRYNEKDWFSRWMGDRLIPWFHCRIGYKVKKRTPDDKEAGIWEYKDETFAAVANIISTTLSSLLPAFSIFILYFVTNPLTRLGAIITFTTMFAVTLAVITNARRVDVFAATTAFAAVQVVFVGNTSNCLNCST